MSARAAMLWFLALNALLVVGDVIAKRAVATDERRMDLTAAAMGVWVVACCMWLPLMRARGFTRLIALADAIGVVMLAVAGYFFLGERLTLREGCGIGMALAAVLVLA